MSFIDAQEQSPEFSRQMLGEAEEPEIPASTHIRRALARKGYILQQRLYGPDTSGESRMFTYYRKGEQMLMLETICDAERVEMVCELYRPVTNCNSIDDTINAIP